jgi:hypothetical protein
MSSCLLTPDLCSLMSTYKKELATGFKKEVKIDAKTKIIKIEPELWNRSWLLGSGSEMKERDIGDLLSFWTVASSEMAAIVSKAIGADWFTKILPEIVDIVSSVISTAPL